MPFKSENQRRFLWMKHPEIARRWTKEYGSKVLNPPGEKKPPFMKGAKKPDDKVKLAKSEAAKRRLQMMNAKSKGK